MPDDLALHDRALGTRYRLDEHDGTWWELGWDRPLGTFYAQKYSPEPYDPFTHDNLLAWHGGRPSELPSVAALAARLPLALPEDIADGLQRDAAAFPHTADPPFLHVARHLDQANGQPGQADAIPSGARDALPAEPVAGALRRLRHDPYLAANDLGAFARGLGIDPALAQAVMDGSVSELNVEQIAHVCEALRASPYDLWGPKLGRQILDAYGPERWPRYIEPLDDGRELSGTDRFIRRRVQQQAAEIVSVADHQHEPTAVNVTRFRQTAVLAVDEHGSSTRVIDTLQSADPSAEYHFAFRRLGDTEKVTVAMTAEEFAAGCPAGHDATPALVDAAISLEHGRPGTDMLRFVDPVSGAEQWLGRETPFDPWQTWDDPTRYYPGDPADVLNEGPGGLEEPLPFAPTADAELDPAPELDSVSLDF